MSQDATHRLRGVRYALTHELRTIDPGDMTTEELVDLGQELWNIIALAQETFDEVKRGIRADIGDKEPGRHVIKGQDKGECNVVVPHPRAILRRGVATDHLRMQIGDAAFNGLFVERTHVSPVRDFLRLAGKMTAEKQQHLHNAVDIKTNPARISFTAPGQRKP